MQGKSMKTTPNLLACCGIPRQEINNRLDAVFHAIFEDEEERFYFPQGSDMGYLMDTGNLDARTEGISYGMMMCVQRNEKELFDRLWRFAKAYMWQEKGRYKGYFAWSVKPDGTKNAQGPAPDGEEYFAMALFFASHRWGDGVPPLDYSVQARDILRHCIHQHELVAGGRPMWDPESALIKFVPELDFSDPSYHLPHFYTLFARWADECDRPFWERAANQSRAYLKLACHPQTGLAPEYANFDGTPEPARGHGDFYSDAYRVAMNVGLDASWFGPRPEYRTIVNNLQSFLDGKEPYMTYRIDGTPLPAPALHPTAIIATTAAASLTTDTPVSEKWVQKFWNTKLRTGERRYYDNCLYFFCMLMLAGEYRIFE
jgi:oligosaccharide reducing-end xylanase